MGIRFLLGRMSVLLPKAKWMKLIGVTHRFIDYHIDNAIETTDRASSNNRSHTFEEDSDIRTSRRTLLQSLIEQTRDKSEIRNQIFQGMMAAQDTTSILLANTVFLLSRHPGVWDRFRAEVSALQGQKLTVDVLKSMKVLRKIFNECKSSSHLRTNNSTTIDTILKLFESIQCSAPWAGYPSKTQSFLQEAVPTAHHQFSFPGARV